MTNTNSTFAPEFTPNTAKFMYLGEAISYARELCKDLPEFRCQFWMAGEEMPRYSYSTLNGNEYWEIGNTGEDIEVNGMVIHKTVSETDLIIVKDDTTGKTIDTILVNG